MSGYGGSVGLKILEFGFWILLLGVLMVEGWGFGFDFGASVNGCLKIDGSRDFRGFAELDMEGLWVDCSCIVLPF